MHEWVWTQKTEKSFDGILHYLLAIWSIDITINFTDLVDHTVRQLIKNPEILKVSEFDKVSRAAYMTKHTTMFCRILNNTIELEYFLGNFDDPEKIQALKI